LCFKLLVSSNSFFTVRARRTTGGTIWKHYEIQRTFEITKFSVFTVKHTHPLHTLNKLSRDILLWFAHVCLINPLLWLTQSPTHTKGITILMCQWNWLLPIHQGFKTIRTGMQASILKTRQ
jgi:hypothetical protein